MKPLNVGHYLSINIDKPMTETIWIRLNWLEQTRLINLRDNLFRLIGRNNVIALKINETITKGEFYE